MALAYCTVSVIFLMLLLMLCGGPLRHLIVIILSIHFTCLNVF